MALGQKWKLEFWKEDQSGKRVLLIRTHCQLAIEANSLFQDIIYPFCLQDRSKL